MYIFVICMYLMLDIKWRKGIFTAETFLMEIVPPISSITHPRITYDIRAMLCKGHIWTPFLPFYSYSVKIVGGVPVRIGSTSHVQQNMVGQFLPLHYRLRSSIQCSKVFVHTDTFINEFILFLVLNCECE